VKSYVFWDITPCSPFKVNRRFGGTCRLHPQSRRISQRRHQHEGSKKHSLLVPDSCWFLGWYSFTLKMNATCCCETSVKFKLSAWHYIPYVHNSLCENLKEDRLKLDPDNDGLMMKQATSLYAKWTEIKFKREEIGWHIRANMGEIRRAQKFWSENLKRQATSKI
jgi:hypothetical protein